MPTLTNPALVSKAEANEESVVVRSLADSNVHWNCQSESTGRTCRTTVQQEDRFRSVVATSARTISCPSHAMAWGMELMGWAGL